jgi:nitrate reductase gamma subunit
MDWNNLLFVIFPYMAALLATVVTIYRSALRPFTISSLSSQLLENKKLFWGSIPFHWGIVLILTMHLVAIFIPRSLVVWNAAPLRLYLLELTGLALGLWSLGGLLVLIWRRFSSRRVWAVTTPMDLVVLLLLLVSLITGVITAAAYRFGSYWFTGVFSPYLASLAVLQPRLELVAPLPFTIKLHLLNFFLLLAVFPFTRLVHILTYPLSYLVRPWQIVIWYRRRTASGASGGGQ